VTNTQCFSKARVQDLIDDTRSMVELLLNSLDEKCGHCGKLTPDQETPSITKCGHFYCEACIRAAIKIFGKCPDETCQCPLLDSDVFTETMAKQLKEAEERGIALQREKISGKGDDLLSSKITALLDELREFQRADPYFKAVVFSQWTSMLDIIEEAFKLKKIKFVRLDGAMNSATRKKNLTAFDADPTVKIFLISLKAGGVGLNLTAANKVFLMDPWWNPATEDQATDRVHRMGQTKEVEVVRVIAENSVEEKIMKMQEYKRNMMTQALTKRKKSKKESDQERLADMKFLLN